MSGGSGGSGSGGRSGGGGGAPSQSSALEMAGDPEKLLSDVKKAKYGDFTAQDKAEYAKYVLQAKEAQTRNDADRASVRAMRAKSQYGAANKTYRGIEKDTKYMTARANADRLFEERNALHEKVKKFDETFAKAGKKISAVNPYGPKYDIKVT